MKQDDIEKRLKGALEQAVVETCKQANKSISEKTLADMAGRFDEIAAGIARQIHDAEDLPPEKKNN